MYFLPFTASVLSRPPGPTLVPGVFLCNFSRAGQSKVAKNTTFLLQDAGVQAIGNWVSTSNLTPKFLQHYGWVFLYPQLRPKFINLDILFIIFRVFLNVNYEFLEHFVFSNFLRLTYWALYNFLSDCLLRQKKFYELQHRRIKWAICLNWCKTVEDLIFPIFGR